MVSQTLFQCFLLGLLLFFHSIPQVSTRATKVGRRNFVPKFLRRLYRAMTVERKHSITERQQIPLAEIPWEKASMHMYFNLTNFSDEVIISEGSLLLYKRRDMYMPRGYWQSFGITIQDVTTKKIVYNATVRRNKNRFRLINLLNIVRRWREFPNTNKGLIMTVRNTGVLSRTLWTFYPRRNINVPALVLYMQQGNYLAKYKILPSQVVKLSVSGVPVG